MSDVHPDESQEDRDAFDQMMRQYLAVAMVEAYLAGRP